MPHQVSTYSDRVRASFARQGLMNHIGAHLVKVGHGEAEIEVEHREEIAQQHGSAHAGALAAIADSACGYAAYSLAPEGTEVLTVGYSMSFLEPARGPRLVARAKVVRRGRTLTVCTAAVYSINKKSEQLVALMTATIFTKASLSRPRGDRAVGPSRKV